MNRREFLQVSAALPLLAATATAADEKIPVLDTHVHLWDLKQFTLPWLKPDAPFAKNFLIDDYLEATKKGNLAKFIYMEVDVAANQKQKEAEWIRSVCAAEKSPVAAAIVGGYPASEGFKKYVTPFKGDPYIKGVRQVVHVPETPKGFLLEKPFVAGVQLLGELGLTFDLCMRHGDLSDATALADKCPDTRFVLDHCGNPDVQSKDRSAWKRDLAELAKKKNVICKISGILFTAPKKWTADDLAPIINHCLDSFGPDRVIFASDWPVCTIGGTFQQWLDAVQEITKTRKLEEQKKLFHDNAVAFYGLK